MSLETDTERRRKRIVEHWVEGFSSAESAVIFGNTIERIIKDKIGAQKFRKYISTPETPLTITSRWVGDTNLKTVFLALADDAMAEFICNEFANMLKIHNDVHKASIKITRKVVRGKPQPQYLGFGQPLQIR